MLICFVGPRTRVRLWGPYEFSRATGFAQEVEAAEVVAGMLTHPGDEFEVDEAEPLLGIVDSEQAGLLALTGVGSVEELAGLKAAGVKAAARECGVTQRTVKGWIRAVRVFLEREVAEAEVAEGEQVADVGGLEKRG